MTGKREGSWSSRSCSRGGSVSCIRWCSVVITGVVCVAHTSMETELKLHCCHRLHCALFISHSPIVGIEAQCEVSSSTDRKAETGLKLLLILFNICTVVQKGANQ